MKYPVFRRLTCALVIITFTATMTPALHAQEISLPQPGVRVSLSPAFNPPVLKGLKVHSDNPFRFDFILDQGDSLPLVGRAREGDKQEQLKQEANKLIKYFLASLTVPEKDLWVNLSPYEKDRIVPTSFGQTEMGRDLLAQDYLLKQITASLIYPEDELGKTFWNRIYQEASRRYHTTNIPVNTFNKVWIVPEKAVVYENAQAGTAYVVESRLKVMLEEDYLALSKNTVGAQFIAPDKGSMNRTPTDVNSLGSQIIREIVIPALTKEINEGKNFAQLRQVYNSLILATWYKKKIKDSILNKVYSDRNKVLGIGYDTPTRGHVAGTASASNVSPSTLPSDPGLNAKAPQGNPPNDVEAIYQQYLTAFKKGVYNYIKEEQDPITQQIIPRKYFSGGVKWGMAMLQTTTDQAMLPQVVSDHAAIVQTNLNPADRAIFSNITSRADSAAASRRILSFNQAKMAFADFLLGRDGKSKQIVDLPRLVDSLNAMNKPTREKFLEWTVNMDDNWYQYGLSNHSKAKYRSLALLLMEMESHNRNAPAMKLWNFLSQRFGASRFHTEQWVSWQPAIDQNLLKDVLRIAKRYGLRAHGTLNFNMFGINKYSALNGFFQNEWGMLNIMIDGNLSRGSIGPLAPVEDEGNPNVAAALYGPFYIIVDKRQDEVLPERRLNEHDRVSRKDQLIYLVPSEKEVLFFSEGIREALHLGLIDQGIADEVLSKLMTYGQFVINQAALANLETPGGIDFKSDKVDSAQLSQDRAMMTRRNFLSSSVAAGIGLVLPNATLGQSLAGFGRTPIPDKPDQVQVRSITGFETHGNRYNLTFEGFNHNQGVIKSAGRQAREVGHFNFFIYPNGGSILRIVGEFPGINESAHFFSVNRDRDKINYIGSTDNSAALGDIALNEGLWVLLGEYLTTGSLPSEFDQQFNILFPRWAPLNSLTDRSPFNFSTGLVNVLSPRFVPPDDKTLLLVGQQRDIIEGYVRAVGVPGGFMSYTSIKHLEGLTTLDDYGGGIQDAQDLVDLYPNTVLQLGLYMVDELNNVNSGIYDANIRKLGEWIKQTRRPVYLRIGYEFDLPDNKYKPQEYIKAYQKIVDILRQQKVTNVSFVWHSAVYPSQEKSAQDWYPGDEYVDWVAMTRMDPSQDLQGTRLAQWARGHNKPFMIAEASPMGRKTTEEKKVWFDTLLPFIRQNNIKALGYINSNWDALGLFWDRGWGDQQVQNDPAIRQLWMDRVIQDGSYLQSSADLFRQYLNFNPSLDRAMAAADQAGPDAAMKVTRRTLLRGAGATVAVRVLEGAFGSLALQASGNTNAPDKNSVLAMSWDILDKTALRMNLPKALLENIKAALLEEATKIYSEYKDTLPPRVRSILGDDFRKPVPFYARWLVSRFIKNEIEPRIKYLSKYTAFLDPDEVGILDSEPDLVKYFVKRTVRLYAERGPDWMTEEEAAKSVIGLFAYLIKESNGKFPLSQEEIGNYYYLLKRDKLNTLTDFDLKNVRLVEGYRERLKKYYRIKFAPNELRWDIQSQRGEREIVRVEYLPTHDNVQVIGYGLEEYSKMDRRVIALLRLRVYLSEKNGGDHPQTSTGGIDFNADKVDSAFAVKNSGGAIKFNIDPAMLQQLQDSPGFVPVIINVSPLKDLPAFLGSNDPVPVSSKAAAL
ncbi:MAG: glycosyl hydrolase [Candidatus Omnitrophota bacterium]|nr:glycosyl hydrolase [Candidatus Omnitrophota bacterium]